MKWPTQLGVESELVAYLPDLGRVRARFRVPNLPVGDSMSVRIRARVYGLAQVQQMGMVPADPLDQGPEVEGEACSVWRNVDLPLPRIEYGEYAVVAKVRPNDPNHTGDFNPSHCYVGPLAYGLRPVLMKAADVRAIYSGVGNPLAEDSIKNQVRSGLIVAEDEQGQLYSVHEENGEPMFDLLPQVLPGS